MYTCLIGEIFRFTKKINFEQWVGSHLSYWTKIIRYIYFYKGSWRLLLTSYQVVCSSAFISYFFYNSGLLTWLFMYYRLYWYLTVSAAFVTIIIKNYVVKLTVQWLIMWLSRALLFAFCYYCYLGVIWIRISYPRSLRLQ